MKVLDHGYVTLIDMMGDDWEPVRAARVSYDDPLKGEATDLRLAKYLLDHGHTSPFEMVELKWEVKAPIFVARQWVRHRTANWNEFSMRYADPTKISDGSQIDYYTPEVFLGQSGVNKQSSGEPADNQEELLAIYRHTHETAIFAYNELIGRGVSREEARAVLPVSTYTRWIWKNDLHNTLHFLQLRLEKGTQWETRQYAQAMLVQMTWRLPYLMELWVSSLKGNL